MHKRGISTSTVDSGRLPLYLRLAGDIRQQIARGVFSAGERLPSVRTLQQRYRVSATTASQAYVRLEQDGYVRARERSGFFAAQPPPREPDAGGRVVAPAPVGIGDLVSQVLRSTNDTHLAPLGVSTLGATLLPVDRLNRAVRRAATRWPLHSASYERVEGNAVLRHQIARLQFAAGYNADPESILVTCGAMEALNLALRAVTSPGDVVAIESPTYFGVLQAIESLGLRALEIPAHPRTGIDLDLLATAIRRHEARAVVVMTNCHNPLGTIMSDARKAALVDVTNRLNVPLIEDDVYGELAHAPARAIAAKSFDRKGLVMLCGSFSKVLAPGLRVGWLDAGRFHQRATVIKSVTSLVTSSLPQLAVAELLETGFYDRHLRRLRLQLDRQMARYAQAIVELFPDGTRMTRPAGGNLFWVQLPARMDGTAVYRRALAEGISILPGEIFSTKGRHRPFIRISCGTAWSPAIERALGTLGELCRPRPRRARVNVPARRRV